MKKNMKWMAVACTALLTGLYGCGDDKYVDLEYKGGIDLNQVNLTQAREVWNGAECNITVPGLTYSEETTVKNLSYKLNISMYQNKAAGQNVTVDLTLNADSLNKAVARAAEGGLYEKYADAQLLPSNYYQLSAEKMTLPAGNTQSEDVSLLIYAESLINYVQNEYQKDAVFVLPLTIRNASAYSINEKVNTLMYFVNVTYVAPAPKGPEYLPVEDEPAIGDPYGDTGLVLAWHDEFNGTGIPDPDIWRFEEGFQRNEEVQWYCDRNAVCQDGTLVITGKVEQVKNPNYNPNATGNNAWKETREYAEFTSSSIVSSYRFHQGTMEVRAKIPTAMGAWPAIWTTGGSNDGWCWEWPLGGEIDLLEYYLVGGVPSLHANVCWGTDTRWSAKWDSYNCPLTDFTSEDKNWGDKYHIWRMDWDEQFIKLYLDDKLMNEIDLSKTGNGTGGLSDWWRGSWRNPFTDKGNGNGDNFGQQIFLNLALGGNGGTPDVSQFPLEYHVDYVRIWQKPAVE